jgi:hypothetical protein
MTDTVTTGEITGGCYCGAVRYRVAGPVLHAVLCYCADCRRTAGAHPVPWITVRRSDFRFETGQPAEFQSSPPVVRTFCSRCGTSLTYCTERRPAQIDVTTASLDDPESFPPQSAEFESEKLSWT